jgi:TolB-like protein/DNA-binding winged helix-turn-helix (wHTH) protein/tetratricopeptide (TPR) repeat protein
MNTAVRTVRVYRFGPFALDARTGELTNAGHRTLLREQPLQLLMALLEQPGELLTREELMSRLWADGTVVDFDRGLNKAVNHLRETLGDSAEQPRYIQTLPRKGYRFIAPVSTEPVEQAEPERPARLSRRLAWGAALAAPVTVLAIAIGASIADLRNWITGRSAPSRISAIAVLPLQNLSRDPEQEYFADGMTDALITGLAKTGSLRVTSRTSVMRYKGTKKSMQDVGRELNVDAVVEGTVMWSGSRVRITAQLIQVSTDMHLWAETYDRDLSKVLELQRVVANDIARRIDVVVKPHALPPLVDPEAYGLYLKGRYYFHQYTRQGWQRAIDYFSQSIERDAGFAPAYTGLADAYLVAGAYEALPTDEALTRGKAAAEQALQLDDTLASGHYALATASTWYDWDLARAEREFRRALELDPGDALGRNWYAGYLSVRGRHEEAVQQHERAREIDPLSLIVNANLTRSLYWARRYDEAIAQARRTLELDPQFGVALLWLEASLRHKGLFQQAVALRQAVSTPEQAENIGRAFAAGGFAAVLRDSAETLRKNGALMAAARSYAQLGDKEHALAVLESCAERRCSALIAARIEPDFDDLRSEPRFQRVLARLGRPERWP